MSRPPFIEKGDHVGEDEFAHIQRKRDDRFGQDVAILLPGDYCASREPMVMYTMLGPCVSACIRDSLLGIGGMNHFLLPEPGQPPCDTEGGPLSRYGQYAMEHLIEWLLRHGGSQDRLEVKLFGGARLHDKMSDVGRRNIEWILEFCRRSHLNPVIADLGRFHARGIYYFTQSGRVLLRRVPSDSEGVQQRKEDTRRDA
jgi:chemotaxis protein CheD